MSTGGMIRQHPARGLWEGRYVGADGRKHSVYAKTRREARERLRAALTAADSGVRPVENRTTVAAYLEHWLGTLRLRPRTIESYADTVRRYIAPAIGTVPLAKLAPEHVERMLVDLSARGTLSPTTIRYVHTVLRIALGRALKSGRVVRNVATLVDPPAKADHELRPLAAEQVAAFLESVESDRFEALYVTAIGLGLRQGELLGLRWQDVDLEAGTVSVRYSLSVTTRTLAEPKTERSRRTLRLPSVVLAALHERRRVQLAERLAAGARWEDNDYVFATHHGRPLMARNVLRDLHARLESAGLPRSRFHDLRHAFATMMLEDGEDLAVISKALGHSNLSTTADVYAHLTPAMLDRTAARVDAVLARHGRASGH
jgi:integrase